MKRTAIMSRGSGFKRQERVRPPMGPLTPVTRGVVVMCTGMATANPKGEKARPGKRTATIEERRWMDFIVEYGCIACRLDGLPPRPTTVHHILRGSVRMGHKHSLGLCDPGHHQGGQQFGMVSRHPDKARFEARYGTEQQLLEILQQAYAAHRGCAHSAIKTGATA